ncbi:hypothetical protein O181_122371 [Austropuccinia psidii MF-1]|uniref:Uncharacterized protein n=1 Tax=Austropuccinia psidii MF-1 TaxID=1389203 RepID=A0A9Q3KM57_9BASI|nr:hypothetical protein [Austropuccinia psidii MF-1]
MSIISSFKDTYKEEFVHNQLVEAQINPSLSPKMRHDIIDVLYSYRNSFASDDEPLGTIKGHEVDITLNTEKQYPQYLEDQLMQPIPELEKPWRNICKSLSSLMYYCLA